MAKTKNDITLYDSGIIQKKIFNIRGEQVMLDSDLAHFYDVETRRLNEQIKRNKSRFPPSFMFCLTKQEYDNLKSQIATSSFEHGGKRKLQNVFTEQGVAMLAGILKSETAIKMSIQIINAFVNMRRFIVNNANLLNRMDRLETRQLRFEDDSERKFEEIFNALSGGELLPRQGIFFEGQIFDAYKFISSLIRKAEKSILLIDNYIDESILELFTKKKRNVSVTVLTGNPGRVLKLDEEKFNQQYPFVRIIRFGKSHDRFIMLDEKELYHFGASLKDLGKKWFAFSKMDKSLIDFLLKVENEKITV